MIKILSVNNNNQLLKLMSCFFRTVLYKSFNSKLKVLDSSDQF